MFDIFREGALDLFESSGVEPVGCPVCEVTIARNYVIEFACRISSTFVQVHHRCVESFACVKQLQRRGNLIVKEDTFCGQMINNKLGIGDSKSKDIMHHNYLMRELIAVVGLRKR